MEIGAEPNLNPEMSDTVGVVTKTDPFVAHGLPKKLGAFNSNRITRQRNDTVPMNIGIRQIHGKCDIVVLNDRAQQQGPHSFKAKIIPGQKPGIVEVKSFGPRTDDANITILIDHSESIAMFQST